MTDEDAPVDASRPTWDTFCTRLANFVNKAKEEAGQPGNERIVRDRATGAKNVHSISSSILIPLTPPGAPMSPQMPQCRLRIRIDIHTELFTITLSADDFKLDGQHLANQRLRELIEGKDALQELHDVFWTSKDTPIGRIGALLSELPKNASVVDFRGVIIPPNLPGAPAPNTAITPSRAEHKLSPAIDCFLQERRELLETYLTRDAKPPNATEAVSDGVICSMLDGLALYAAPLTQWAGDPRPVRYLLVADNLSPDQLGRFVRRLHVLGELRHVALFDFDLGPKQEDLKRASRKLRSLSRELDDLASASETELPPVAKLVSISKKLTALHKYADGGLPHRVSQSQYYAQAFKDRLPDLRVGRIEGYQPYDAFARRFVYQVFARIEQVGQLYRTVVNETNRWTFLSEANSSSKFHVGIEASTKETRLVGQHLIQLQQDARDLLLNAEKFAAIFLVYYVGSIFVKFLHTPAPADHATEAAHSTSWISEETFNWIWGAIVVVVILDLVRSKRKRDKQAKLVKEEKDLKEAARNEAIARGEKGETAESEANATQESEATKETEDRGIVWYAYKVVQFIADVVFFVLELPIKGVMWLGKKYGGPLPYKLVRTEKASGDRPSNSETKRAD